MRKKISLAAACCVMLSTQAFAGAVYELSPMVGKFYANDGKNLEDVTSLGLKLDRYLSEKVAVEAGYDRVNGMNDREVRGGDRSLNLYTLGLKYDFAKWGSLVPYVVGGVGYQDYSKEAARRKDSLLGQWGLGAKYAITEVVALRAEAKQLVSINKPGADYLLSAGLSFSFGETPKPAPEVKKEAPKPEVKKVEPKPALDSDGDGVLDENDKCPNTPKGYKVDKDGCVVTLSLVVHFDTAKKIIKKDDAQKLTEAAELMKKYPAYTAVVSGNTDNVGSKKYNKKLSEKRSLEVKKFMEKAGVDASRVSTAWYDFEKPTADNGTAEGKAKNRRTEINVK